MKNNNTRIVLRDGVMLLLLMLLSFTQGLANQEPQVSIFDELSYQEETEVTLETDMNALFENRRNNDKHKAIFSYVDKNGASQNWFINVSLRGKFRRTRCAGMAPLKLNFKKGDLKEAGLAKFDDMKLVTHCVEDKKEAKQLLAKEYVAYKLYNQISERSFRVQFVKIKYVDINTGDTQKQWGILIEDTAQLRARIDAEKTKKLFNQEREKFHVEDYKRVALFQYMIGNSDWSSDRIHNIKFLSKDGKYLIVPYDFDFSGLVDAPYATVRSELEIENNQQRVYLGFKEDLDNYSDVKILFQSKKEELLRTIQTNESLSRRSKKEMIKYLESFYDEIDSIQLAKEVTSPPTLGE